MGGNTASGRRISFRNKEGILNLVEPHFLACGPGLLNYCYSSVLAATDNNSKSIIE